MAKPIPHCRQSILPRVNELRELAMVFAEDGAYQTAAEILTECVDLLRRLEDEFTPRVQPLQAKGVY